MAVKDLFNQTNNPIDWMGMLRDSRIELFWQYKFDIAPKTDWVTKFLTTAQEYNVIYGYPTDFGDVVFLKELLIKKFESIKLSNCNVINYIVRHLYTGIAVFVVYADGTEETTTYVVRPTLSDIDDYLINRCLPKLFKQIDDAADEYLLKLNGNDD